MAVYKHLPEGEKNPAAEAQLGCLNVYMTRSSPDGVVAVIVMVVFEAIRPWF
jgi:hypothetical protein